MIKKFDELLIFEKSTPGRRAYAQAPSQDFEVVDIPGSILRRTKPTIPETSELQVIRHFTRLSQKNYAVNTHFVPLGSCTMKYSPHAGNLSMLPGFANRHPYALLRFSQGVMKCLYELQEYLKIITGMAGVSLVPMAGAQGELAGMAMIKAYLHAHGKPEQNEILIPDAAHGTNPASAVMCGFKIREIPTDKKTGDINLEALKAAVGPKTAGIMLTNPSTLGVFERHIKEISDLIHSVGGLLYYDGANLNAIVGKTTPAAMGFDVVHMNIHKTFGSPHGSGGPGAGPVAVGEKLKPFLPVPIVGRRDKFYVWLTHQERENTIGYLSGFMGNISILLRTYIYIRILGRAGLMRIANFAVLNSNYLFKRLQDIGYTVAFPQRRAAHEFIITLSKEMEKYNVRAYDFAKRLLDYNIYAPTIYFPLLIHECMLIEPTETESKVVLDIFVEKMKAILEEAKSDSQKLRGAPYTLPVKRLDDIKAVKELNVVWRPKSKR